MLWYLVYGPNVLIKYGFINPLTNGNFQIFFDNFNVFLKFLNDPNHLNNCLQRFIEGRFYIRKYNLYLMDYFVSEQRWLLNAEFYVHVIRFIIYQQGILS